VLFRVVARAANRARPIWNSILKITDYIGARKPSELAVVSRILLQYCSCVPVVQVTGSAVSVSLYLATASVRSSIQLSGYMRAGRAENTGLPKRGTNLAYR
jgi:hypothetical protein